MSDSNLDIQSLFSLEGKVALVTGGSRGIGYMITQGLLQAGARVYISARKAPACEQLEGNSLLGRVGQAAEMAGIAVYLSGRAGAFTHGAIIPVDGGTSINHQHAVIAT